MDCFGIFAKYWQPGAVKSRLAATLGEGAASAVYRCFVATLVDRFRGIAADRHLVYTPADRRAEMAALAGDGWACSAQAAGDLGVRMRHFFQTAFDRGARRVLLIGSDSPTLPVTIVQDAFQRLGDYPVVLGPTRDGGYYLVGAAERVPPIFENIAWSSDAVWDQTVLRLAESNCPFARLPAWYDVDTIEDLRHLFRELENLPHDEPAWNKLRWAVERALESAATR